MAEQQSSYQFAAVEAREILADRQQEWQRFTRFTTYAVAVVIVVLVALALFVA
jgi:predicted nucleic acid-binding Zn ribbon protein